MHDEIESFAEACAVHLYDNGRFLGTGFIVGTDLVVACAHEVEGPIGSSIQIITFDANVRAATVIAKHPEKSTNRGVYDSPDIAVVRLDEAVPNHSAALAQSFPSSGSAIVGFGYTRDMDKAQTHRDTVLLTIVGRAGEGLMKVQGDRIPAGLSGAPLLDKRSGAVIGMIKGSKAYSATEGGWAIPAATIADIVSQVADFEPSVSPDWMRELVDEDAYDSRLPRDTEPVSNPTHIRRTRTIRQFPPILPSFIGRGTVLAELERSFYSHKVASTPGLGWHAEISGMAGVGKTTTAVQLAHRIAAATGSELQLFVNLYGSTEASPPAALNALASILRSLEIPDAEIPDSLPDRQNLLRSTLSDRRAVIVLDDASDSTQVEPLIADGSGIFTIITSRRKLLTRSAAIAIDLPELDPSESVLLISELVGNAAPDINPDVIRQLAEVCGNLPIAIDIVSRQLRRERPQFVLDSLTSSKSRPDAGLAVSRTRTSIDRHLQALLQLSYLNLPRESRRAFRLLALHVGSDFTIESAAGLLGCSPEEGSNRVANLVENSFVIKSTQGQHHIHDLLRSFSLNQRTDRASRRSAQIRMLNWYYASAIAVAGELNAQHPNYPPPELRGKTQAVEVADNTEAMEWFDREGYNLIAAVQLSLQIDELRLTTLLSSVLLTYFLITDRWTDWLEVTQCGLEAAKRANDRDMEGKQANNIALAYAHLGRDDDARRYLHLSLQIRRDLGDRNTEAIALNNIGLLELQLRNVDLALEYLEGARTIWTELGNEFGDATTSTNIAAIYRQTGDPGNSIENLRRAASIFHKLNNMHDEAIAYFDLGSLYLELSRISDAEKALLVAIRIRNRLGDQRGSARARGQLALLYDRSDHVGLACYFALDALPTLQEHEDEMVDAVRDLIDKLGCEATDR